MNSKLRELVHALLEDWPSWTRILSRDRMDCRFCECDINQGAAIEENGHAPDCILVQLYNEVEKSQ